MPAKFAAVGRIFDKTIARAKGLQAAELSCAALVRFLKKIGMDFSLGRLLVPKEELDALALQSFVLPDYRNHPKVATLKDVTRILEESH